MAQKTSWTGSSATESDINTYLMHEGGAWSSWTPAIVQNVSVAATVNRASQARAGRLIRADCVLSVTGAGTAANTVTITVPANNIASANNNTILGEGYIFDSSAGAYHYGVVVRASATTVVFQIRTNAVGATFLGTTSFTAGLASGDVVTMSIEYECSA